MARHKKPATKVQVKPETGPFEIRTAQEVQAEPEIGHAEIRTTQAEYPPYSQGCPECHGVVVTRQRLFSRDVENIEIRVCRCRTPGCNWEGRLMR